MTRRKLNNDGMAQYFTLKELCTTTHKEFDNFPTFEIAAHLEELTWNLLDPLRRAWGSAIKVNSGYRCTKLNTAVGGVATSAHKTGYAADLHPANGKVEDFCRFARTWVLANRIKFDQLIRETDKKTGVVWLHIGLYGPGKVQRGQILDITKQ